MIDTVHRRIFPNIMTCAWKEHKVKIRTRYEINSDYYKRNLFPVFAPEWDDYQPNAARDPKARTSATRWPKTGTETTREVLADPHRGGGVGGI